jgi:small subunit ribosomal protein S16
MLTIRLQRAGKRNSPQYTVVLAQKTAANQKQFVEVLGSYNPHTKELAIRSQERLDYWMNDQHVPLSATVHNLFVTKELVKADKVHAFAIPKKSVEAVSDSGAEAVPSADGEESAAEATTEEVSEEVATESETDQTSEETSAKESTPAEEVAAEPAAETPITEEAPTEETPASEVPKESSEEKTA